MWQVQLWAVTRRIISPNLGSLIWSRTAGWPLLKTNTTIQTVLWREETEVACPVFLLAFALHPLFIILRMTTAWQPHDFVPRFQTFQRRSCSKRGCANLIPYGRARSGAHYRRRENQPERSSADSWAGRRDSSGRWVIPFPSDDRLR